MRHKLTAAYGQPSFAIDFDVCAMSKTAKSLFVIEGEELANLLWANLPGTTLNAMVARLKGKEMKLQNSSPVTMSQHRERYAPVTTWKLRRNSEWNDWIVKGYDENGKHIEAWDYHTDDKQDAQETLAYLEDKEFGGCHEIPKDAGRS
jgi:hypothetical protein